MIKFTKTDRKRELEGTWLDFDDGYGVILKIKVARSTGNPYYNATLTKKMKPYQKQMEKGNSIGNDVAERIMTEVMAEEILLGWDEDTLTDEDGKGVPYSSDAALELLSQDVDLRDFVVEESGNKSNFLMKKK